MEKNLGTIDRVIRFIIGLVGLYLAFTYSLWWFILVVIMFVTSATGSCWVYKILGIRSLRKRAQVKAKPVAKSKKKKI